MNDAGITWTNENTAYVVGTGAVYQTMDAGNNWDVWSVVPTQSIYGASFVDANTGVVVGHNGVILRTRRVGGTGSSSGLEF